MPATFRPKCLAPRRRRLAPRPSTLYSVAGALNATLRRARARMLSSRRTRIARRRAHCLTVTDDTSTLASAATEAARLTQCRVAASRGDVRCSSLDLSACMVCGRELSSQPQTCFESVDNCTKRRSISHFTSSMEDGGPSRRGTVILCVQSSLIVSHSHTHAQAQP